MADIRIYECFKEDGTFDFTLEVWASSTEHPDAQFYFSDFQKSEWVSEYHQIFQWLLECASKMRFPSTAKQIAEIALEKYVTWGNKML
jgi:hypothetical protein